MSKFSLWICVWQCLMPKLIPFIHQPYFTENIDCLRSNWGPWRCPHVSNLSSKAHRFKCAEGDCIESSLCSSYPGNREEKSLRFIVNQGLCQPWWSNWSPWSSCSPSCGLSYRRRSRNCIGIKQIVKNTCFDDDFINSLPLGQKSEQISACSTFKPCLFHIDGWSQWGKYGACSVSCGSGVKVRYRKCINSRGLDREIVCPGQEYYEEVCDSHIACPQDGGWCDDSTIRFCNKSCGGGYGYIYRRCECPQPAFGGRACTGLSIDLVPCNTHFCPYQIELNSEEKQLWVEDLAFQYQRDIWDYSDGEVAKVGDNITLFCSKTLMSRLRIFGNTTRFPKSQLHWLYNGMKMNETNQIFIDDELLSISFVNSTNVGFYSLVSERDPGLFDTLCFFSVYLDDITLEYHEDDLLELHCNAGMYDNFTNIKELGNWTSEWLHHPSLRNQSESPLLLRSNNNHDYSFQYTDILKIESIDHSMSGTFTCQVINTNNLYPSRRFITEKVFINVIPQPSLLSEVYLWIKKRYYVMIVAISVLIFVTIIIRFQFAAQENKKAILEFYKKK